MTDFATLRTVNPGALYQAGQDLQHVAQGQQVAYRDYVPMVVLPIERGAIWAQDPAQPMAGDVTHGLAKSFDTASIHMTSAATTCMTLFLELTAAKKTMEQVVDLAERIGFVVHGDGTVTPGQEQLDNIDLQRKYGSPVSGHLERQMYNQATGYQEVIALAVKRATDADEACTKMLREIADSYLVLASTSMPGLRKLADDANTEAAEQYGRVLQMQERLAAEATRAAEDLDLKQWGLPGQIWGIFKGLWSGIEGLYHLGDVMHRASEGDPEALAQLDQMVDEFDLGDLIALDKLKEGRWGEFIGVNAWWFIPMGKLGTLTGKTGTALVRTARQTLANVMAAGKVPAGVRAANSVTAVESRAVVAQNFREVLGVNADRFNRGVPGHNTNCLDSAKATDMTLDTGITTVAKPSQVSSPRDLVQHYGRPLEDVGSYGEVIHRMQNAGDGARGIVLGTRDGMPGHAFNVVNKNGEIYFIDGQTGQLAYLEDFASMKFLPTT
ncbi:MAG: hypothetical protein GEV07_27640 [Streptosporangiales bacterium]|nr:hypothetical protein [Streptosporangiales bacterium]